MATVSRFGKWSAWREQMGGSRLYQVTKQSCLPKAVVCVRCVRWVFSIFSFLLVKSLLPALITFVLSEEE